MHWKLRQNDASWDYGRNTGNAELLQVTFIGSVPHRLARAPLTPRNWVCRAHTPVIGDNSMMSIPSSSPANVRVDAWLWAIRAYKTRSAATAACRAGHIRINGNPVKASQSVIIGDTIRVRESGWERILEVRRLIAKRVGAEAASHCFTDHTPPRPVAPKLGLPQRDRGAGRPTKKDRRDMEKLRG
ncbi:hypothetical protein StoSoilB22_37960 [Arthrobacter sp. StoSoilB22]|nr:hypothetical protein StoSoilB22_37960 [Arthrobacter sp. StoSoilB22]